MSLINIDSKLSLQGKLPDSSVDTVISTNGKKTVTISEIPSLKDSTLYSHENLKLSSTNSQDAPVDNEPAINNKYSISSNVPEPLAIFSFRNDEIDALYAAAYQSYFEDKCSLAFSEMLIKKAAQENNELIKTIAKNLSVECDESQKTLDAIENFFRLAMVLGEDMNSLYSNQLVSKIALQTYIDLNPDPLQSLNQANFNVQKFLEVMTSTSKAVIEKKSNVTIMTQMLYIAAKHMKAGASANILGSKTYKNLVPSNTSQLSKFVQTEITNSPVNLGKFPLGNLAESFLFDTDEKIRYMQKLQLGDLKEGNKLQKAAYLVSMLANEFAISTGLGRLENVPLGQQFGPLSKYEIGFFGADFNNSDAYTEASSAESLRDYFIVNVEGNNRVRSSEDGYLLYDGPKFVNQKNRLSAFSGFVEKAVRSPVSDVSNRSIQFSDAVQAAGTKFDTGAEFLKILHCRDKKAKLLTPRGLFCRILKDLSGVMKAFDSKDKASKNKVAIAELCMLSMLGSKGLSSNPQLAQSVIKRSLLNIIVRKAFTSQAKFSDESNQVTDSESQSLKNKKSTTVTTKTGDDVTTTTIEVEESGVGEGPQSNPAVNPNQNFPRFCLDERKLRKSLAYPVYSTLAAGFDLYLFELGKDTGPVEIPKGYNDSIAVQVVELYKNLESSTSKTFLYYLSQIYVDMLAEAQEFLEDENSSLVRQPVRLTRNSSTDGTLLLSLLLEAACLICSEFLFDFKPSFSQSTAGSTSSSKLITNMKFWIKTGSNSSYSLVSNFLTALSAASDSDDLDSIFVISNSSKIVPSIGGKTSSFKIGREASVDATVDVINRLVFEREMPSICFSIVNGMVQTLSQVSKKYTNTASSLLNDDNTNEEIVNIRNFAQSEIGKKFCLSLNDFSLNASKRRLKNIKSSLSSPSGRLPKITIGELRCIKLLLNAISSNPQINNFIVVAITKDFVLKNFGKSYSLNSVQESSGVDETVFVDIKKSSVFGSDKSEKSAIFQLLLREPFTSDSFSEFEKREPESLLDIVSNVLVDDKKTGSEFSDSKKNPDAARLAIVNEVYSYLFRKMFSIMSSADLFSDNIVDTDVFQVDSQSSEIARTFSQIYGLPVSTFDNSFSVTNQGITYIDEQEMTSLTLQTSTNSNLSVIVSPAVLKFGEAELFYDLFHTVYFQTGTVFRNVFSVTILDSTLGILTNQQLFPPEESGSSFYVTPLGQVSKDQFSDRILKVSGKNLPPSFDTYSVELQLGNPLVNK